jgi:hypothetical protein
MDRIKSGFFEVINPFNQRVRKVPAPPADVHTIVFWSKNFHLFLKENCGKKLQKAGYNLFFNFTINSESPRLEPHVPPLDARLDQLKQLCDQFGSRTINWRFDPICFFKTRDGNVQDNLNDLDRIVEKAAEFGIQRCITSFMDPYPKIQKRLAALPGFSFSDPQLKTKKEIILKMEQALTAAKINLQLCCEKEVLDALRRNAFLEEGHRPAHTKGLRLQSISGCRLLPSSSLLSQLPILLRKPRFKMS